MRPKVKYWVYTGDPWVCRSSQIVDSHWRPVKYIICAAFGCLRRKIALWVTCAGSARWRHNALRREVNCLTLCADSNLSSHTAERQTMIDGKTETKRAGGGVGVGGRRRAPSWEIGCLWKKGSFKVKSLRFANPLQAMLSPLPVRPFHHSADMNSSLCRGEIPLAGL